MDLTSGLGILLTTRGAATVAYVLTELLAGVVPARWMRHAAVGVSVAVTLAGTLMLAPAWTAQAIGGGFVSGVLAGEIVAMR